MALKPLPPILIASGVPVADDFFGLSYPSRKRLIIMSLVRSRPKRQI
jgi:hypothetical protein